MSVKYLFMVIGVPGVGKSTYIEELKAPHEVQPVVLSTDSYIENKAKELGITYKEAFKDHIKDAQTHMDKVIESQPEFVIWDQTNTNRKSRKAKLAKFPDHIKIAVCIDHKNIIETVYQRNNERAKIGRDIPWSVLQSMVRNFEYPTVDEGFSAIYII